MINPYQAYRATAVTTASPVELVLMMYQGVLRFTQQGIRAVERGDHLEAHNGFLRAQEIVAELMGSLDLEAGGELGQRLFGLYDYAHGRLVDANCRKSAGPAIEAIALFRELLPAWQALADGRQIGDVEPVAVVVGVGR